MDEDKSALDALLGDGDDRYGPCAGTDAESSGIAARLRRASAILRTAGAPRLVPGRRDLYMEAGMQPVIAAIEAAFGGSGDDDRKDGWEQSYDMLADVFEASADAI